MKIYLIYKQVPPLGINTLQDVLTDRQAALEMAASSVALRMEEREVNEEVHESPPPVDRYWPMTYWRCGTCQATVSSRTEHDKECLP